MRIVIIRSSDDRDFDRYIVVHKNMSMAIATRLVDETIKRLKEEDRLNWDEEIEPELLRQGFNAVVGWDYAQEEI